MLFFYFRIIWSDTLNKKTIKVKSRYAKRTMVFSTKSVSGLKYNPENIESTGKNIHITAEILSPSVLARTEVSGEGSYILYVRGILKSEDGSHIINQSLLVDGGVSQK